MDNLSLKPEPFLGGYARKFGGTSLTEVTDLALLSIAQPLNGRVALAKMVKSALKCALPDPGNSTQSKGGKTRLLCLGPDSFMAIVQDGFPAKSTKGLGKAGYITDQSDHWVALRLSGPLALRALERVCPVDLHDTAMPVGGFARTIMEHLGVIILREGSQAFLLLSASSSAKSFLHTLETSVGNVRQMGKSRSP